MTSPAPSPVVALARGFQNRRFPYTTTAFAAATLVLLAAAIWQVNVIDLPGIPMLGVDPGEADEVLFAFLLTVPAFFIDTAIARRRKTDMEFHAEQLRVVRITMRTVQDIVNNNLNQLQLLRIDAEGCVPEASLVVFDQVLQDTATELTTLGNIEVFIEQPMQMGPGVKGPAWEKMDPEQVVERLDIIQRLADELAKCSPNVVNQTDLSSRLHQQVQAARRALNR